jgi:serine/threonine-protein kinase HipA
MDLSNSVENEYFCLKLLAAFGLPVAEAEIQTFGRATVLVVTRFDREWTTPKRLIRLPQEDCCQALSIPSTKKYQPEGGPGIVQILQLLNASDNPRADQVTFLKAQILFWLIGATDGHAKNFSIFLGSQGSFHLTPIYDVLSAQPSLKQHQIEPKQMRLAMFVGDNRHYRLEEIQGRHFIQTVQRAHLPKSIAENALKQIASTARAAIDTAQKQLPRKFPGQIADAIIHGLKSRLSKI